MRVENATFLNVEWFMGWLSSVSVDSEMLRLWCDNEERLMDQISDIRPKALEVVDRNRQMWTTFVSVELAVLNSSDDGKWAKWILGCWDVAV